MFILSGLLVFPTKAQEGNCLQPPPSAPAASVLAGTQCSHAGSPGNPSGLDFREVPIETVLEHLSTVYGFIITGKTDVEGEFSIIAHQPVSAKKAIDLLNAALARVNYQAVLTGRILTVMTMDAAKQSGGTPVEPPVSASEIPQTDTMVTQILPVHSLNPTQLAKDLQPLFPAQDTLTPNEAGSAIVMTARQADAHRLARMIEALDTTSVSEVRVFLLKYADSKSVALELKDIFSDPNARTKTLGFAVRLQAGTDTASDNSKVAPVPVNTVSDDQNNAVLVSAPPQYMETVSSLVNQLDQPTEPVTVARVFHLNHADPVETASELTALFPDDNSRSRNSGDRFMGYQYVRAPGGRGGSAAAAQAGMKRKSRVIAVPDRRSDSVIVTAAADLIPQIAAMVRDLDELDPEKQVVVSLPSGSSDASEVQAMMQDLFQDTRNRRGTSSQINTALEQRQTQAAQQQSTAQTGSGLSSPRLR